MTTPPAAPESLLDANRHAVLAIAARDPRIVLLDADRSPGTPGARFAERFPDRYLAIEAGGPNWVESAAERSAEGQAVFVCGVGAELIGPAYSLVRRVLARPRAHVILVAAHGSLLVAGAAAADPLLEDIGVMRGLPGMTVVVPADAPTTTAASVALAEQDGPAYLRLTRQPLRAVTDGSFRLGRAGVPRDGSDLAIVAIGAMVARSLELAEELARVGVSTRVIDLVSVKPFDEPAILRAARDTGAILVAEEHSVLTGVGALVASVTAENYPVPVRRIGVPDLFGETGAVGSGTDGYGLSLARMTEEAWELLRIRGKVE